MSQSSAFVMDLSQWCTENHATPHGLDASKLRCHPHQITTDSREIPENGIYIPLQGEHFDGHDFILQSLEAGARVSFCQKEVYAAHAHEPDWKHLPLILVDDTLKAFQSLAHTWRRQLNIPVIAITGSSGKTSTKEILKQVFARDFKVHATPANWNNEIGVPKTLLMLTPEHDLCLVEMGMRGLGQIQELCEIAAPDYGVITNIGPVHLGELGSQEAITQAKWELADYLFDHVKSKTTPCLVINGDNLFLQSQYKKLPMAQQKQVARVGQAEDNELRLLESISIADDPQLASQQLRYQYRQGSVQTLTIDLLGIHQALNLLSGLMLLNVLQKPPLVDQILSIPRLSGRQESHPLPDGGCLINDTYNANPDAMRAAIGALKQLPGPHIAVLGMMGELGPDSETYHRRLGAYCAEQQLEHVVVVGEGAAGIMDGLSARQGTFCHDAQAAVAALTILYRSHPHASVLIKASRSARLEEVVNGFLAVLPCQT
jgi:UDP-N-acetylmuramoyl-tripeptide--D-alanyl-D-alanine ligase